MEGPDPGVDHNDVIGGSGGNEDADMGSVQEDESEEEMGMVHGGHRWRNLCDPPCADGPI